MLDAAKYHIDCFHMEAPCAVIVYLQRIGWQKWCAAQELTGVISLLLFVLLRRRGIFDCDDFHPIEIPVVRLLVVPPTSQCVCCSIDIAYQRQWNVPVLIIRVFLSL
jgi:hypothetical protein